MRYINSDLKNVTIKDFVNNLKELFFFLVSKRIKIILISVLGALLGLTYALFKPVEYISKVSFVVEESKGGGGLASLAGQFGFDIGGLTGGGFFSGDNILLYLKSERLCRETLMTPYDKEQVLADKYAEVYGLKKRWENDKKIGSINFTKYKNKEFPRLEDSLMQYIIRKKILENDLMVSKPDKKASFILVVATMRDELMSKLFTDRLVEIATKRYVESKTKIKKVNVDILQRRADSLSSILNVKTFSAASTQQTLIDVNPAIRSAGIPAEISAREKATTLTIFSEVVKNLEISKTILNQEMPVIQVIDKSYLPLEKERVGKIITTIISGFIFSLLSVIYFSFVYWMSKNMG
jgi:hypothetical protein